jgi:hypothetical protein
MGNSGIFAYIEYGKQTNFTTALSAGAATRAFGMDQKVTAFSINENIVDLGDLNTALVQKYAFGTFEGSLGVEWVLSNPWWIDMVLGNAVTSGVGPFTHTYDDVKTVNAFTTELGFDAETTDRVLQLQRLTAKSIGLSFALNETVKVRGDFQFGATPTTAGTTLDSSISTDDITTPMTLVQGTVENPSGTALAEVQSGDFTINPNIKMIYEPNSANAVNAFKGKLELTGRFVLSVKDNTWYNNTRARVEPTNNTLRLKFTNGLSGTSERTTQFTFTGLGLGTLNMPIDQYELVTDEVSWRARDLTAVAINNTSSPP